MNVVVTQTTINASVVDSNVSVAVTQTPISVTVSPVDINSHVALTLGTANGLSLSGQVLSLGLSSALATGALSSADWSIFNGKLSDAPTDGTTYGRLNGAWSAVVSSVAWGGITGTLSNQTDLQTTLDAKVPTARTISTTSPLSGGGDLSANRTISISLADTSTSGYLSSTDWNTFNNKQSALGYTPLNPANNLSDVSSVSTSRTNLGLGAIALEASPLAASKGGTGIAAGASASLSLPNLAITLGGGGAAQTYTLPAAGGTFALLNAANVFSVRQVIDGSADEIQLAIQSHSTQTTNPFEIQTSAGARVLGVAKTGQMTFDIGTLTHASGVEYAIKNTNIAHTISSSNGAQLHGLGTAISINASGTANASGIHFGDIMSVTANVVASGARISGDIGGLRITASAAANMAGLVDNLYGISVGVWGFNNTAAAGTITNLYGVRLAAPTASSSTGVITNVYGLHMDNISVGGTLNYAIYTNAGLVRFGDVVNTTASYQVDGTQVVTNRVIDARIDDAINSGDATTDGVIDAIRDALITHGLISAS